MSLLNLLFKSQASNDVINRLSREEFKTKIAGKKIQLVDVRTAGEFQMGHIKNAINLDFFNQTAFRSGVEKLKKEEAVYVYCRSGNRSQSAAGLMAKMGFTEIYDLKNGYMNWVGIEPTLPKELDFESSASTNSATEA
jgi:rhodanese-related sulfurtransferase